MACWGGMPSREQLSACWLRLGESNPSGTDNAVSPLGATGRGEELGTGLGGEDLERVEGEALEATPPSRQLVQLLAADSLALALSGVARGPF